jgi:hypothetical protein
VCERRRGERRLRGGRPGRRHSGTPRRASGERAFSVLTEGKRCRVSRRILTPAHACLSCYTMYVRAWAGTEGVGVWRARNCRERGGAAPAANQVLCG